MMLVADIVEVVVIRKDGTSERLRAAYVNRVAVADPNNHGRRMIFYQITAVPNG